MRTRLTSVEDLREVKLSVVIGDDGGLERDAKMKASERGVRYRGRLPHMPNQISNSITMMMANDPLLLLSSPRVPSGGGSAWTRWDRSMLRIQYWDSLVDEVNSAQREDAADVN